MQENNSLRDKFDGFTSEPNPNVWENIERSLDEKPRKNAFVWWWTTLAASLVIGIVIWTFQGENSPKSIDQNFKNQSISENLENKNEKSTQDSEAKENEKFVEKGVEKDNENSDQNTQFSASLNSERQSFKNEFSQRNTPSENKLMVSQNSTSDENDLYSGNQNGVELKKNENKKSLNQLMTEILADKKVKIDSILNSSIEESKNNLNAEKDSSALAISNVELGRNEISADSSDLSNQEIAQIINENDLKKYRWELQFQFGAFATGKAEMHVPVLNQPYYETSGNTATNGVYANPAGGQQKQTKTYRNILSNYGLLASYNTSNRWRFSTGFSYLRYYIYTLDDRTLRSGTHFVQIPIIAEFKIIDQPKWNLSVGWGTGFGYVFDKKSTVSLSSWRTDFIVQTSVSYSISERFSLQIQPQARFIYWDKQNGKVDKLSPWYWGGNIGGIWRF